MSKKKKSKGEWSYEKTSETEEALKRLHETIRMRKLKEHDDKMGYETGGK
jgi:outer membrane protein assembly factor BamD (BamD/ComL family)